MRTVAILQARLRSTRLPGKVLEVLGSKTVLLHCLDRAAAIPGVDAVCLATSKEPEDDLIVAEAGGRPSVVVFRGSEHDVLARYAGAARETSADVILRVTCDCPLIDPDVCGSVLRLRADRDAAFAANNYVRQWPHGLDCEVFTRNALEEADAQACEPYDREHVGPFMRRATCGNPVHLKGPGGAAAQQRWTLDYPEDLEFLQALWPYLPHDHFPAWREVLSVVEAHPAMALINAKHVT